MKISNRNKDYHVNKAGACLFGLLVSYIASGLALLVLAFILYKTRWGDKAVMGGVFVVYLLANTLGGYIMGKSAATRKYLWGLLMGAVYFLILCLTSLLVPGGRADIGMSLFGTLLVCLGGGMAGGMIS